MPLVVKTHPRRMSGEHEKRPWNEDQHANMQSQPGHEATVLLPVLGEPLRESKCVLASLNPA